MHLGDLFSSRRGLVLAGVALLAILAILIPLALLVYHPSPQPQTSDTPGATVTTGHTTATAAPSITVQTTATPGTTATAGSTATAGTQHYEYVFPDGGMYVYDMDHNHTLVKQVSLPTSRGVRGVVASPATHMLYVSYGGDGAENGDGALLKYDLLSDTVVWTRDYQSGIDSMAITPDGKTIYMPDGELSGNGTWNVIDAGSGTITSTIEAGTGPHNTIVSLNGKHVYMGGRNYNYLEVADTATNTVIQKIGPLQSGVRPFTINAAETLAYTTATGFLGFQVSDISTGKVLYTVPINGFSWDPGSSASCPSHGISLSPDEKELYVIDSPNNMVHVFDVSGLPASAPKQVADIRLRTTMTGNEQHCAYDCLKDGWLQHSRDGRFVYVGDSGDVIDTSTRTIVATLPALSNSRKFLEIDWANGVPTFSSSRSGLGYGAH